MSDIALEPRKGRGGAIANAEWHITIQLTAGDDNKPVGEPFVLRYADSVLAAEPRNVGYLIAARMNERAGVLKRKAKHG